MKPNSVYTAQEWAAQNPFLGAFVQQELDNYGYVPYEAGDVAIAQERACREDYLNATERLDEFRTPTLRIGGKIWMNLGPMEMQAQYLPIQRAEGHVATCGLGLGHFVLRAMQKAEVERVTVFEQDRRIVTYFTEAFGNRKGFEKVIFVLGDAREAFSGYDVHVAYVDIYRAMLGPKVPSDVGLFCRNNDITHYHWWGRERWLLDCVALGIIQPWTLDPCTADYFRKWKQCPLGEGVETHTLGDVYKPLCSPTYAKRVLDAYEKDDIYL